MSLLNFPNDFVNILHVFVLRLITSYLVLFLTGFPGLELHFHLFDEWRGHAFLVVVLRGEQLQDVEYLQFFLQEIVNSICFKMWRKDDEQAFRLGATFNLKRLKDIPGGHEDGRTCRWQSKRRRRRTFGPSNKIKKYYVTYLRSLEKFNLIRNCD